MKGKSHGAIDLILLIVERRIQSHNSAVNVIVAKVWVLTRIQSVKCKYNNVLASSQSQTTQSAGKMKFMVGEGRGFSEGPGSASSE